MDLMTILGFVIGFGSIFGGYMMDGGKLQSLWTLSAFIITIGGSIGALFTAYGPRNLAMMPKMMGEIFINPKSTIAGTIDYLVLLATKARQGGLLSLEKEIDTSGASVDPFIKRGVLMVVDGTDPDKIREVLENDIYIYETDRSTAISMFESFGAFAPAFGMVGTIVGLIMTLAAGMSNPDAVTQAIAVAFITTLYGVVLANSFFNPAATKLRNRMSMYRLEKEMIIEAVCAIRNGINPRMLQEQLSSYYMLDSKKPPQGQSKPARGAKGSKAA